MSRGLFDRDVFLKLACVDLWQETVEALGIDQPYRLPSTTSMSSSAALLKRRGMPDIVFDEACARLKEMVVSVPVLPAEWLEAAQRTDTFNKLIRFTDAGEAGLTTIALEVEGEAIVITGDKRHVAALKAEFPDAADRLGGRLFTFEDCLLACLSKRGFAFVRAKATPAVRCDGMLTLALSSGLETSEQHFCDALRSYKA